jgi:6-pyruvoyltetrahydropterin/6-carboxytetrahydropterin synthase
MSKPQFRVELLKEQLVFSAAHFITFAGDICERIHGHNYGVQANIAGSLDENRYVIDFIAFRDALAKIVAELDHHVLLPTKHAMIKVTEDGDEVVAKFRDKRWVFPREDCVLLPIINTTAEEIACWIVERLHAQLRDSVKHPIDWVEVGVDENNGQWGFCRIDWS